MLILENGVAVLESYFDNAISKQTQHSGDLASYDPRIREIFCPLIPRGGVVVDGGAFIGDHTIAYAEAVGPTGEVWAFEPSFQALACLTINTERFPQVRVVPAALADHRGTVELQVAWDAAPCSRVGRERPDGIPAVPLDAFTFDRLHYVKLDLEGYELRALRGAVKTLRTHRPILVVESGGLLKHYGDDHESLCRFMDDLGYDLEPLPQLWPGAITFDVLFRPRS